jgi:hypothetical protein
MDELLERKSELKKKILIMEWDKKRSQLNFGHTTRLEELKKELSDVEEKLKEEAPPPSE